MTVLDRLDDAPVIGLEMRTEVKAIMAQFGQNSGFVRLLLLLHVYLKSPFAHKDQRCFCVAEPESGNLKWRESMWGAAWRCIYLNTRKLKVPFGIVLASLLREDGEERSLMPQHELRFVTIEAGRRP